MLGIANRFLSSRDRILRGRKRADRSTVLSYPDALAAVLISYFSRLSSRPCPLLFKPLQRVFKSRAVGARRQIDFLVIPTGVTALGHPHGAALVGQGPPADHT